MRAFISLYRQVERVVQYRGGVSPRCSNGCGTPRTSSSIVSLLGDGSSLAIAGAHTLATALAAAPAGGFGRYEIEHRAGD